MRSSSTGACFAPARWTAPPPCPRCLPRSNPQQIKVASVTVARPSLDDVYLRFAGSAFEQAENENKGVAA